MQSSRTQLIRDIFVAAAALRGEERARYLAEHCPDAEIRRELEHLLEADRQTEALEDSPLPASPPNIDVLAPGSRLGHYEIRKKLGSGGMGVVYEALDRSLRRTVAIKVLPPTSAGTDHRRRFAREAQSASALNHPNIVTVYEVGREGDFEFIAMERVEGETLSRKIGRKGVDVRTALRYASQMADALAAAHDAGIVHRDLKPGNVMITDRDLVKVLDFGLAKQTRSAAVAEPAVSEAGQVIGTFSYMSPEQAEGKPVDTRSDIFSFGSVLFEMLTGRRAFADAGVGTLAAIVQNDPPISELPAAVPRSLTRILAKCLAKRPADRWQHMSDVKLLLDDVIRDVETPPAEGGTHRNKRLAWAMAVSGCVAGVLLTAAALRYFGISLPGSRPEPVMRMVTADNGLNSFPTLSRDGKLLAFASDRNNQGNLDIWIQQIGGRDAIRLTKDPADDSDPDFSPDGTRVAYRSEKDGGGVYVVSAFGGENPVLIARGGRNPRFSPDGKWIAYWTGREGANYPGSAHLFVIESGGGPPHPVHAELDAASYPTWSPNGTELLAYGKYRGAVDWYIAPIDAASPVVKTGVMTALTAQGLAELQIALNIRPVVPLEWTNDGGSRVLFSCPLGDVANLWEVDLDGHGKISGTPHRVTRGPGRQVRASRSVADGVERIAFSNDELNFDIWGLPIDADAGTPRGAPVRLTTDQSPEWAPSITTDGSKLAYISRRGQNWLLRTKDLRNGLETTIISSPLHIVNARIAADGSRLLYSNIQYDLYSVPVSGGAVDNLCGGCGTLMGVSRDGLKATYEPNTDEDLLLFDSVPRQTVKAAVRPDPGMLLSGGQLSPDQKWVAFHSLHNPGGVARVWIAEVRSGMPAAESDWIPVSGADGADRNPAWAPSGSLLYFLSERDGFRCIWARRLDPHTKHPSGDAFAVQHFHSARLSLQRLGSFGYLTGLTIGGGQLVFAMGELTGNIWLSENHRSR